MTFWFFPALFATGLAAGFVDSIAGGGGLITLPVLLNLGIAPGDALGTNKFQATFGSASAAWHYRQAGKVALRDCYRGILFTALGAAAGTLLVQQLDPALLRLAIPFLLIGIATYLLLRPKLGLQSAAPRLAQGPFHVLFGLLIGFYDGFFGPGTGSFWATAYVLLLGFDLTRATAHTKVMNFTSNVVSLLLFALAGHVHYEAGLVMGCGQMLGARMGSRTVIKRGAAFIRPVFIAIVLVISGKLIFDQLR